MMVTAVSMAIGLIFVGYVLFRVHWGNPASVFLVILLLGISMAALAVIIGTWSRSQEQAIATAVIVAIIAGMFGGCVYQLSAVSTTVKNVGHIVPQAWAMDTFVKLISDHATVLADAAGDRCFGGVRGGPERAGRLVLLAQGVLDDVTPGGCRPSFSAGSCRSPRGGGACAAGQLDLAGGDGIGDGAVGLGDLEGGDGPLLVRDLLDLVQAHQAEQDEQHQLECAVAGHPGDHRMEVVAPVGELGDGQLALLFEASCSSESDRSVRAIVMSTSAISTLTRSSTRSAMEMSRRAR